MSTEETAQINMPSQREFQTLVVQNGRFRHGFMASHLLGIRYRMLENSGAATNASDSRIYFFFTTMTMVVSGQGLWALYCLLVYGETPKEEFAILQIQGEPRPSLDGCVSSMLLQEGPDGASTAPQ